MAHCLRFVPGLLGSRWDAKQNYAPMALKDILEDFIKYKDILDDLYRNGTESSSVETYEKQFMVRYSVSAFVIPEVSQVI